MPLTKVSVEFARPRHPAYPNCLSADKLLHQAAQTDIGQDPTTYRLEARCEQADGSVKPEAKMQIVASFSDGEGHGGERVVRLPSEVASVKIKQQTVFCRKALEEQASEAIQQQIATAEAKRTGFF